jgi:cysteine desulfurase/selenocysteine lyase
MDVQNIAVESIESHLRCKRDFPIFKRYPDLVFLDSSSTTQKPQCVIDALVDFYETSNANAHRGVYKLSQISSERFESAREKIARFLGASSSEEIVFTRGTTESINLVAHSFLKPILRKGDLIVLGGAEHHANIVPWQIVANEVGAKIEYINILDNAELDLEHYKLLLEKNPKFVAVAHISNVLGIVNDVDKIVALAREKGIPTLIDGAQSVAHGMVDVEKLGCDFFVFSGHKAYGPMGIGVLYAKKGHLESMTPFLAGGGMIENVGLDSSTYIEGPHKFEAGTQSIADAFSLGVAIEYIEKIGRENIQAYENYLTEYAKAKLQQISGLECLGEISKKNTPIFSFNMASIHPHDLATILDEKGVAVRAGHHCSQHAMNRFGCMAAVRASFGIYNSVSDIDALVNALMYAKSIFKRV